MAVWNHSGQLAETSAAKLKKGQINGKKSNKSVDLFWQYFPGDEKSPHFFKSFASIVFSG
jgi:hypothetical protein